MQNHIAINVVAISFCCLELLLTRSQDLQPFMYFLMNSPKITFAKNYYEKSYKVTVIQKDNSKEANKSLNTSKKTSARWLTKLKNFKKLVLFCNFNESLLLVIYKNHFILIRFLQTHQVNCQSRYLSRGRSRTLQAAASFMYGHDSGKFWRLPSENGVRGLLFRPPSSSEKAYNKQESRISLSHQLTPSRPYCRDSLEKSEREQSRGRPVVLTKPQIEAYLNLQAC